MAQKIIYAARHGLTLANIADCGQGLDDPLAPEGIRQAERLAVRAKSLSFDLLLSSDAVRAVETARAIAQQTGHEIVTSPLYRERKGQTSLIGVSRQDPRYAPFIELSRDPARNEHIEDEENFFDVRERCIAAMRDITERPEESIFLVTHGLFLRLLAAIVILDGNLQPEQWRPIYMKTMHGSNTGITVFRIDDGEWSLVTWNDLAHLAD